MRPCVYIDDVPVLFSHMTEVADEPLDPRIAAALDEAVPGRWRDGTWDGEYPLTGEMLAHSLALSDELDDVFRAHGLRP